VNLRQKGRVLRIGHRGAAALASENTLASIEAAIEYELDLVEIDVVAHANALRLAHSPAEVSDESPTLDEALALVARTDSGAMLDLKSRGIERSAVEALREHDLLERSVVASFHSASLRAAKEVEPALTTGLSYPFDRAGLSGHAAFEPLIRVGLSGLRRALPARIAGMLARAQADALVVHHALVSRTLVDRCHGRDAAVLAWTVEDDAALEHVLAAGVDGVIANDPRLLGDLCPARS
jgi:glycerophosphoryl diester phosphodiesterase